MVAEGVGRISEAFAAARASGRRAALMPYLMAGYPDIPRSRAIARAYLEGGADLVEIGLPFSDPLADGPVIHAAAVDALAAGVRIETALKVIREIAQDVPVIVMCYANPILVRGVARFADRIAGLGACGLIVPDLPLEEAPETAAACERSGLALVPLVAPTTPEERLARIGAAARGFVYAVSVTGTTGERADLPTTVPAMLRRLRGQTDVPIAVGFGIGTPSQASAAARAGADGVIVGTRLVRAAGTSPPETIRPLIADFAAALRDGRVG